MADTKELVRLIGTKFISRRDVKAVQKPDGSWFPVKDRSTDEFLPFKMQDFEDHLAGRTTLGHYMLGLDDTCKLFAFDIDLAKNAGLDPETKEELPLTVKNITDDVVSPHILEDEHFAAPEIPEMVGFPREWYLDDAHEMVPSLRYHLKTMAIGLASRIIRQTEGACTHVAIADSGSKGLHVYGFLPEPMPADIARNIAVDVLDSFEGCFEAFRGVNFYRSTQGYPLEIEVFPKQTSLEGKQLGNLMSLPLGINQKTGRKKFFITSTGRFDTFHEMPADRALDVLPWE